MRRALAITAILACACAPKPPYARPFSVGLLAGGGAASPEGNHRFAPAFAMGAEVDHRPFGGALVTGVSLSSTTSIEGRWNVTSLGLQAKVDALYVVASHFWTRAPPPLPLRVLFGGRLGVDVSVSQSPLSTQTSPVAPYMLIFPGAQLTLDTEVPLDNERAFFLVGRAAFDMGLNRDFERWSALVGLGYGWGR